MELRNLKTFIRAAELMSFSRAAERLGYAQSTVTAQVEALEQELGTELFIRNGKRISLSAAGKELLSYAYQFRMLEDEVKSHFDGEREPEGELRVGILESISASEYAAGICIFLKKYPKVKLKVTVSTTLALMDALKRGEMDVILLLDSPVLEPEFKTVYKNSERILFFASSDSRYRDTQPVLLEELHKETWILTEKGCNYRKSLEDELLKRRISIRDCLEIGSTRNIIDFVAGGLGISLLPEFDLKKDLEEGRITGIPIADFEMKMEFQILVSKERWMPPALKCFCKEMEMAVETEKGGEGK